MPLSSTTVRAAAALATAVLVTACSTAPDCDESACGDGSGTVTAVGDDGGRAWSTPVRDTGASVTVRDGTVVVDGCRAVTVLDARTGTVLLETTEVEDAGAVVGGLLVGSGRTDDDDDGPRLVGVRLDGSSGGSSWSRVVGGTTVAPSPVTPLSVGFAVAYGDSLEVVTGAAGSTDEPDPVQLPADVVGAPTALDDGVVLAATADGSVYGIRDGALRWRVVPAVVAARITTSMTRVGGRALVSSSGGDSVAETASVGATGEVGWRATGAVPRGSVLGEGAGVVLLATLTGTHAHDLRTGARLWDAPLLDREATVVVTRAGVVTTEVDDQGVHRVVARDPRGGGVLWQREGVVGGPAGGSAVLVKEPEVRGEPGSVSAVDLASGDLLWARSVTTTEPTSALVAASPGAPATTLVVDVPPRPMVMCE